MFKILESAKSYKFSKIRAQTFSYFDCIYYETNLFQIIVSNRILEHAASKDICQKLEISRSGYYYYYF